MLSPQIVARSRVSDGDLTRLQHVLAKARRGEPITIGVIGGSITLGEHATDPSRGFANLVADWWRNQFPDSKIMLVNAGVENTGSNFGCLRVRRDLLSHHPDFVIVEFGVNDKDEQAATDTYEGVVRQIMMDPDHPAVVLLFMMHHTGTNAQAGETEVGRWYQLPMISYRDALWPEITAGRIKLEDCFTDTVHPNDRGHAAVAEMIDSLLQETLDHLPADSQLPAISTAPLPPPRFTDLFARTRLLDADQLHPVANTGWEYDPVNQCWESKTPGNSITFEITGSLIDVMFYRCNGGFGIARASVDDDDPINLDGWFEQTWGGFRQTTELARGLSAGKHRVRIDLLDQRNPQSTGNEFRILGLGAAGL
jgi:lysophospholipase L1-like esterase